MTARSVCRYCFFACFVSLQAVENDDAQAVCLGALRKQPEVPGKSVAAPFHHHPHRQQEEESYGGW